jgi:carbonic anhydrase/acetyltransferase-like protein (isoleucine patch superfamily)
LIRSLDGVWPKVHPTAFVSEDAYVVGDVEIGEGSSVWPRAVVRADSGKITIGKQTCIQEESVVHGDKDVIIGDRVVVGKHVLCHARDVGDRVLISTGATVNDGVVIGEDSHVAAGSVLIEFMEVAPGSVVEGVPGRVRREVDEEHREMARSVADDYVERAQQHVREDGLGSTTGD